MTDTAAPIATRTVHGIVAVIASEAALADALDGAPITITQGPAAGDVVHIGTAYAPEPGSKVGWAQRAILQRFEHPQHGTVVVAAIDTNALDNAPALTARQRRISTEITASERRIAADNARIAKLDRNI
jgi:hypothetical protein